MTTEIRIDLGNDVPAVCEHPDCDALVHRGVVHICGMDPAGASGLGCGLHFCGPHLAGPNQTCDRCAAGEPPYTPKTEVPDFPDWRMTGAGWGEWRKNNPELVARTYGKRMADLQRPQGRPKPPAPPEEPEATAPEQPPAEPDHPAPAEPEKPEHPAPAAPGKPEKTTAKGNKP